MNILLGLVLLSTWGVMMLGLLAYIVTSSKTRILQNKLLELNINSWGGSGRPPQEEMSPLLKTMIQNSANHPEAQEIEPQDELVGIIFEGGMYPPEFDEDDDYYEE